MSRYNVFEIPKEVFDTLKPLNFEEGNGERVAATASLTPSSDPAPTVNKASFEADLEEGKTVSCSYCGQLSAQTAQELRDHYKKDYHRFNIRRKMRNESAVSEEEFERMAEDLDESLSGSDDDDESESDEEVDRVSALMDKASLDVIQEDEGSSNASGTVKNSLHGSPYAFFTSEKFEQTKCLAVYKNVMNLEALEKDPLTALRSLNPGGHSVIVMIGGGHFSAAVFAHAPIPKQKPTISNPFCHVQVLAHKTFHRYTTRRKQGGSQAASDAARGKANSAGSSLRRYNEQALQSEVRELLLSWKAHISSADNIYIRANGKTNRSVIANYENAPISTRDSRVKSLPFSTSRATSTAVKRAWVELTTANVVDRPKAKTSKPTPSPSPAPQKQQHKEKPAEKQLTPEETHTNELIGFIKKSRSPRITAYLKTHKLSPDIQLEPESQYTATPTPLFYAASHGMHHVVHTLLTALNANPGIKNVNGRYPYEVADRATKDAFQQARQTLGESKWDWDACKVGPPLTKKDIEERAAKEKAELDKSRKQELEKMEKEEKERKLQNTVNKHGQGKKLASNVVTSIGQDAGLRGLSEEARMRLERERRARAAEARFKKQ
jgi:hypothetical protein